MDAHVCDYLGEKGTHICYNDAAPIEQAGHSAGLVRFFDNTYTQVGTDFGAAGDLRGPDIHELNTPEWGNGETFLVDIYEKRKMDLTEYDGPEEGYILDGCFQEVDIKTKAVAFQWCALDHIPIWHTYTFLKHPGQKNYTTPITANGSWDGPWDWMHFNAVSKNEEGDYVISARHHNTIYKIAGNDNNLGLAPGEIIWRLGGKFSDFEQDFNFSRQHTVRFVSTGKDTTVISLFNNAYDGLAYTAKYSDAQIISLNNETMNTTLLQSFPDPMKGLSPSQGSVQILPNKNVMVSWGNRAWFSEFAEDGKLLYNAHFGGGVESFRAWKFPWKGYPKWAPKLLAYAHNDSAPLHAYVSWNGATEVTGWQIHASMSTSHGPWKTLATVAKDGFETHINFTDLAVAEKGTDVETITAYPFIYATALDSAGKVLAHSDVMHTFIPNATISRKKCNETACHNLKWFDYDASWSIAQQVEPESTSDGYSCVWPLLFLAFAVEIIVLRWFGLSWGFPMRMAVGAGRRASRVIGWGDDSEKLPFLPMYEDLSPSSDGEHGRSGFLSVPGRPGLERGSSGPDIHQDQEVSVSKVSGVSGVKLS